MGCIEGRIALEYFDELGNKNPQPGVPKPITKNFAYKCHRFVLFLLYRRRVMSVD